MEDVKRPGILQALRNMFLSEEDKVDKNIEAEVKGLDSETATEIHKLEQRLNLPGKTKIPVVEQVKQTSGKSADKIVKKANKGNSKVKLDNAGLEKDLGEER